MGGTPSAALILAAAAVVAAVNLGQDDGRRRDNAPPANDTEHTAALYFVGDTPAGPRLYREFQTVPADDPLAALEAITRNTVRRTPTIGRCGPQACSRQSR